MQSIKKLNKSTLDDSISQQLERIKQQYQELKNHQDIENQLRIQNCFININKQLSALKEETDYWLSYRNFDR